jgi:hypothetical protein
MKTKTVEFTDNEFNRNYNSFIKDVKRMDSTNYLIVRTSVRNFITFAGRFFNDVQTRKMDNLYEICL